MHTFVVVALVASMLAAFAGPAEAQGRGYRGLFGGAQGLNEREHVFDLTGSLFGSYITNIIDDAAAGETPPPGASPLTSATSTLMYQRNWRRGSIGAFGTGGVSYVFDEEREDPWVKRWQAGVTGSFEKELTRRTRWRVAGHAVYSPNYSFGLGQQLGGLSTGGGMTGLGELGGSTADVGGVNGVPIVPGLDYDLVDEPVVVTNAISMLDRSLSSKGSVQAYYAGSLISYLNSGSDADQFSHVVGGRYRHRLNRFVSARAGYAYRRSDYGEEPVATHDVDVGVDGGYGREFALGRRTIFTFNTRTSVYVFDQPTPDQGFSPTTRFFVGGSAALTHSMGRTWTSEVRYERSTGFTVGFPEPFFSHVASAFVRGLVTRRVDVVAIGRFTTGEVGFSGDETTEFWSATSQVQVRTALGRHLAAHAQYFLYQYHFGQGVALPGQLRPTLDRQGVSVGITAWVPLL
jgi:hypothetical protein